MVLRAFSFLVVATVVAAQVEGDSSSEFDWSLIQPTTDLQWFECYTPPIQCARLLVPLDYGNIGVREAAIALARVPSPLIGTDAYRGPLLYNPGGPGASGVKQVVSGGTTWNDGGDNGSLPREFDFVSFDPRGIGHSTPNIQLFNNAQETAEYNAASVDIDPESWDTLPRRLEIVHQLNERIAQGFADTLAHMTTENVARDMLRIVEAHGLTKLQYYGVSYGTTLGATFATMFPDRVERMIIDAVEFVPGYYAGDYTFNIIDSDSTLLYILSACSAAGPTGCAFWEPSIEDSTRRFNAIINSLDSAPLPIDTTTSLTGARTLSILFDFLYSPSNFSKIIAVLVALEKRDLPALATALSGDVTAESLRRRWLPSKLPARPSFNVLGNYLQALAGTAEPVEDLGSGRAIIAYWCTDAAPFQETAEQLQTYATRTREISTYFPTSADLVRIMCSGWKVNPNAFRGPIGAEGVPMLVIGNTFDPITPLEAARRTAASFPGSQVLTYDAPGHGALDSPCVQAWQNEYLLLGTLPPAGTVCNMSEPLFGDNPAPPPSLFDFEGIPYKNVTEQITEQFGDSERPESGASSMRANLGSMIGGTFLGLAMLITWGSVLY